MISRSTIVRAADFEQPWFRARAAELRERWALHRKLWEFCTIGQVFEERFGAGSLAEIVAYAQNCSSARVLGFGVGQEPLPAWFAMRGAFVIATDAPPTEAIETTWGQTGQHAAGPEVLRRPWCPAEIFERRVRFEAVDMNAIPPHLMTGAFGGFDLTWSCGSLEHLGSFERSYRFLCRQMACLRPGGLAVHTTEFNPYPHRPTVETPDLVLFREQELREAIRRLEAQGDRVWPLDLTPGDQVADQVVDREPYGLPHLRVAIGGWITTSILLVIERGQPAAA